MSKRFQDTVRLTQAEQRKLLDTMDRTARDRSLLGQHSIPDDDRRTHRRHTYRPPAVAIQVEHPGGGSARYLVGARNLSRQGIGLIHGGFLYNDAPCTVVLETRDKQLLAFHGRTVNCRHVDRKIHEIGVRFDREIEVETYFQLVEPVNLAPQAEEQQRAERKALSGSVLYIDPSIAACDQTTRYLSDQPMTVVTSRHLGGGLDALRKESFDVVVCEADLDGIPGDEALTKIRKAGHEGPLAFVTGHPDQARDSKLLDLGAALIAIKPLNKQRMQDLIDRCLNPGEREAEGDLCSMLDEHMDAMQRRIDALEASIIRGDIPNLRMVCESIAHASNEQGHEALASAADEALKTMRESGSTHAAMEAVQRVAALAQAIRGR